jgi:hypothetical protein
MCICNWHFGHDLYHGLVTGRLQGLSFGSAFFFALNRATRRESACSCARMRKADVASPLEEGFHHVGLLYNEPSDRAGLPIIQSSEALKFTRRCGRSATRRSSARDSILSSFACN